MLDGCLSHKHHSAWIRNTMWRTCKQSSHIQSTHSITGRTDNMILIKGEINYSFYSIVFCLLSTKLWATWRWEQLLPICDGNIMKLFYSPYYPRKLLRRCLIIFELSCSASFSLSYLLIFIIIIIMIIIPIKRRRRRGGGGGRSFQPIVILGIFYFNTLIKYFLFGFL